MILTVINSDQQASTAVKSLSRTGLKDGITGQRLIYMETIQIRNMKGKVVFLRSVFVCVFGGGGG